MLKYSQDKIIEKVSYKSHQNRIVFRTQVINLISTDIKFILKSLIDYFAACFIDDSVIIIHSDLREKRGDAIQICKSTCYVNN